MDAKIKAFTTFLDASHSVYHSIAALQTQLEEAGYSRLSQSAAWELVPGGKYYLTRHNSTLLAFRIPTGKPQGFMMSASHADCPGFKLKENGELTGAYTRLATEKYGGPLMAPWLDRPLSLAGKVMVETQTGVESRLVDMDRDLLLIPNVAIHMNRKANEGFPLNPAVDTLPLLGGPDAAGRLTALLEEAAGGRILGHDLFMYAREKARIWGMDEEYVSAQGLDDRLCAWCCTQGFLNAGESDAVPILCVFDSEEVGSATFQGAGSTLLENTLARICDSLSLELPVMLSQSFIISADNAHALHPNHPEYADATNAPLMNRGIAVKFQASMKYTTDGVSAALFRKVCQKANVPVQTYCNRADQNGGGTLGSVSLSHVSVPSVDIGLPQLAMHSAYETAGVKDVLYLTDAMTAFYSSTIACPTDGCYLLK